MADATGTVERAARGRASDRPRRLLLLAGSLAGGGTLLPQVVARVGFGGVPSWLLPAQAAGLLLAVALTTVDPRLRDLRPFAGALLVALLQFYAAVGGLVPDGAWTLVAHEAVQLGLTGALLAVLLAAGHDREDLSLRIGALDASGRLLGVGRARPWRRLAPAVGAVVVATTAAFLLAAGAEVGVGVAPSRLPALLAVVVPVAAANAFTEEVVYRAAPLAGLDRAVGRRTALALVGAAFGLSHYFGTPGGPAGMAMAGGLGWILGESVLDTDGLAAAWGVHVALDVVILTALLA